MENVEAENDSSGETLTRYLSNERDWLHETQGDWFKRGSSVPQTGLWLC